MSVAFKAVAILCGLVGLASSALGQETPKWSDIDCAQSKIEGPTGLRCRATQEYSGGTFSEGKVASKALGAGGTSRNWSKFGTVNGMKLFYFLKEATSSGSNIFPEGLEPSVKEFSPQGRGSTGFSSTMPIAGGDFLRFTDQGGENCIAVRKLGPSTRSGNKWYLLATECARKEKTLSDADVASLLASADAPKAGY